jgi:hypothetical protein
VTDSSAPRSVFGQIDQDRILSTLDVAADDGVDSDFFAAAVAADSWSADTSPHVPRDVETPWRHADGSVDIDSLDPEARAAFILHGPGALS